MKPQYRVLRAYGPWSVGHIFIDMPGNVARTLMSRKLIEEIPATEKKEMESPVNRMMKVPVNREGRRNG